MDYLTEQCVLSDVEVQSEIDRYIEWPGQALSYMTGRCRCPCSATSCGSG
ncbi:hypothetical protein H074_06427 [Amycolatopsis decaplanina DSM 44594]|uniref:Uncharacterized protein n=1 Tax=Amycolatopsis decaplanina DSM 44594 TaxID=1284240 RepID=M2XR69_9PSEU|nr:hypothetical protein H074_06427 [Amycolatopsis decaplanina DSM 44594]